MRRLFAFLVFLFGLALAVGYPMLARLPSIPVGTWPVYAPVTGFMPIIARLKPDQAPVEVYVDLTSAGSPKFSNDHTVLTLTASVGGKTVLAVPLSFENAVTRDDTPQTPEPVYRARAGVIDIVEAGAPEYLFTPGPGDADGIDIAKVDLVLEESPPQADPRAQPIGFTVMAVGAVAFLLSFRGGGAGPPPNPNSKPPPPRWGRAAGDRK